MKFKIGDHVSITKDCRSDGQYCYRSIVRITNYKDTASFNYLIRFADNFEEWVPGSCLENLKGEKIMGFENSGCKAEKSIDERGLYEIIAVNPTEDGDIILVEKVVANGHDDAKFSSNLKEILKEKKLRRGDVDVIVNFLGTVRPYEIEQKVKIVGSVDGYSLVKKQ
jgi:hypothetical protein